MKTTSKKATTNRSTTTAKPTQTKSDQQAPSQQADGLMELFEDGLKDIYWAEKALTQALPKMIKKASAAELVSALEEHLSVTEQQVSRLEEVFDILGMKKQAKKCAGMQGLIDEGSEMMESTTEGMVRDAAIIAAGQKVEHYEISSYGTLCAFAKNLGENKALELLMVTLEEEKAADQTLTDVAETAVYMQAESMKDDA